MLLFLYIALAYTLCMSPKAQSRFCLTKILEIIFCNASIRKLLASIRKIIKTSIL